MEDNIKNKFRLKNEITGEIEETLYNIIYEENDSEIPGLVWLYLESEYGDENINQELKIINGYPTEIHYARITNNSENLLV